MSKRTSAWFQLYLFLLERKMVDTFFTVNTNTSTLSMIALSPWSREKTLLAFPLSPLMKIFPSRTCHSGDDDFFDHAPANS
jgi:hypothetical protein